MGPTRDGRLKPDIAAPGLPLLSSRSFDAPNNCPGSGASALANDGANHLANAGTRMAAPHTAGAVALLMQKFGAITPAFAKTYFTANAVVDDIVYVPLETRLLAAARARGQRCIDGLDMLLHQGRLGFEAWFGQKVAVSAEQRRAVAADLGA